MEDHMLDDQTKELVRNLNNPHRVTNIMALFKILRTGGHDHTGAVGSAAPAGGGHAEGAAR